jgi:predicted nucleotidyltransferase
MTLLQQRDEARRQRRLQVYHETRTRLREYLSELIPGQPLIVFGSLCRPGVFNDASDVDIALETELPHWSAERLGDELMERLGRPVDVVVLNRSRLRAKILREGERWTS